MSTSQKPKQPTSRWGFLSQAVASVESGLDRILAEEEDAAKRSQVKQVKPQENASVSRGSSDAKRTDSSSKTNDRLQSRLAQAMAKKAASRASTPVPESEPVSRAETPITSESVDHDKQRLDDGSGTDADGTESLRPSESADIASATATPTVDAIPPATNSLPVTEKEDKESETQPENSKLSSESQKRSVEHSRASVENTRMSTDLSLQQALPDAPSDPDATLLNAQIQHEKSLGNLQDEISGYLERIDALQRNIQILTKETIQNARQTKSDSESEPIEKQLAEKDEKIALLIEEGTKLTKGELQYRNTIKKLRAQATTLSKDQEAVRQRAEKAEEQTSAMQAKITSAEAEIKRRNDQISSLSKSSADLEVITKERSALTATLADVRAQLSKANKRAEDAESRAQSDKLEIERRKNTELQDDLSSAKVERELSEDKFKREIENLRQSLIREKEQARLMETEMLAEQATLESKLESFRVRAEEASTGDIGDSRAKLLRQIETLQNQYSAASQNWQGIESNMLGRITVVEKERDEVVSREADLKRKLRDALNKARSSSKELEETQQSLHALQDQEADNEAELQRMTKKTEQLESETTRLRKELEEQKQRNEKDMARRLEEERAKWIASMSHRVESPVASVRRGGGGSFMDSLISPVERSTNRRPSTNHFHDHSISRINSSVSVRANGAIPETPSISVQDDQDDFFANIPVTPASGTHADSAGRHGVNDVISASTAGAGPSVQLVERMSANVRRLESEKAASKDEIARLSSQRDEARQEVVNLMREVEVKRTTSERLSTLEKAHTALSAKHQATLELLGEKSEQVEELKADILDVKQMYRQLADTMGK